ncbi:thioredoxin reductase [Alicyclobacillus fastidiosus]|nr:thioredoxin reductase [Alicyclobacillus fastidiosus]
MLYDCLIIGGGIAGLQAAIQLGRYRHTILVIDSNSGRSNICRAYHNILGWPDGVSGPDLRRMGRAQAEACGVEFVQAEVTHASLHDETFRVETSTGAIHQAKNILIATGLVDRIPDIEGIHSCLGASVYVCPDCDGYEIIGHPTVVIGSGDIGAHMALTLSYWCDDLTYIDHERTGIDSAHREELQNKRIPYIDVPVQQVLADGPAVSGVELANGRRMQFERGFVAFGGNVVRSQLAVDLGVTVLKNKHIPVDARTKETNVQGVWAAGDVVAHSEQVTISMGDGAQAAIWIHKRLMKHS